MDDLQALIERARWAAETPGIATRDRRKILTECAAAIEELREERQAFRERSRHAYRNEHRFNQVVQTVVFRQMHEYGPIDPHEAPRAASEIATAACAFLLQRVYEDDAELKEWKRIAERMQKLALDSAMLSPQRVMVAKGAGIAPDPG
jgi:hypothetical protein